MKIKIIVAWILTIIAGSCSSPRFLPYSGNIDVCQYGSYIKINHKNTAIIKGELIAIDSNKIVVLTEIDANHTKKYVSVPINEIQRFNLQYAKPKHYGWTIPVFTLATFSHGYFLIFTAPVNLIVTISVNIGAENAFIYRDKELPYEKLNMFARFPQGIPPGIDMPGME